jgi:PKHD-type hydroxylase
MFDYCWLDNYLNNKDIKKINKFIEKNFDDFENKEHHATHNNKSVKNTITKLINFEKIKKIIPNIQETIHYLNREYFGYDIYNLSSHENVNHNIYSSKQNGSYDWHTDASKKSKIDIKLTALINLSEEKFEGGNFLIFNGTPYEVLELRNPGTIVVFKSYLNHKVEPVTLGIRKSLTFFIQGPNFK